MAGYEVKLERFEGPLDLLLHLIQRDEIDVYDIPIARITQQYLTYIELMRLLDLDVAGEFLVMAATLMRIKARMLLPTPPPGEEEEIDPRDELVRRLLEYREFKEASVKTTDTNAREIRNAIQRWRGLRGGSDCPTISQLVQDKEIDSASKTDDAWGVPFKISCSEDDVTVISAGASLSSGTTPMRAISDFRPVQTSS